jgi:voltage-gated potassium channel
VIVGLALLLRRALRRPPSLLRVLCLLVAVVAYGTCGFMFFEVESRPDLEWVDALWWTLVTLTTVGYGDFFPTSVGGRFLVAVPVMVLGIGLLGYLLSIAATTLVEARTKEMTGMGNVKLKGHLLVVNFPSLVKVERLLDEVESSQVLGPEVEVVIVDEDLDQIPPELARRPRIHFVRGNPARDETLSRAAVEGAARAVILSKRPGDPHSDDLAIAVVLAIESRRSAIHTVAECVDAAAGETLRRAGCNSVVCTSRFDAQFLGAEMAMPGAQEVVDQMLSMRRGPQLLFVSAPAAGTFAEASAALHRQGRLAIGVRRDGRVQLGTPAHEPVTASDQLVVLCSATSPSA